MKKTTTHSPRLSLVALCIASLLAGCTNLPQQVHAQYGAQSEKAQAAFNARPAQAAPQPAVRSFDRPFLAVPAPRLSTTSDLNGMPPSLAKEQVTFLTASKKSLPELVSLLSSRLGLPVRMDASIQPKAAPASASPSSLRLPALPGSPVAMRLPGLPDMQGTEGDANGYAVNYTGPLSALLDAITSRFGVFWSYENGAVVISRFETRVYHLPQAFAGTMDVNGSIGGSSSGSSGGGSSSGSSGGSSSSLSSTVTSDVSMKASGDIWKSMTAMVKSVIASDGEVTAAPELGLLVVRTTPQRLLRVDALVNATRSILSRKVLLRVRVYSVSMNKEDQAGFNLNAILTGLLRNNHIQATLLGGGGAIVGAGGMALNYTDHQGNQSSAVVQALSTLGNVSTVYDNPITTQSGQAVPVANTITQGYVASTQTTVTPNVGSQTTVTPGSLTYGYSMTVLPRIIDDKDIALQVQLNISNLLSLQTFGAAGNQVQLPTVQSEPFMQRTLVRNGQTVLLMGLQQVQLQDNHSGTIAPDVWALGGSKDIKSTKQLLVVLVTPEIME